MSKEESSDAVILQLFSNLTGIPLKESKQLDIRPLNEGLRPADLHCYQLALEACARLGYSDTAFSIIESMLSHGKEIREKKMKRDKTIFFFISEKNSIYLFSYI
jgi:hypothetical protein